MMKKIPWGVIAGVCLVLVFYLTAGIVAGWIILDRIEAETTGNASLFQEGWQIALFVADVVVAAVMAGSLAMFIRNKIVCRGLSEKEEAK